MSFAPHILGIDDGSFSKAGDQYVDIAAVMMEGATLVEGISINQFTVDGKRVTAFLNDWIQSMKWFPSLQAVMFGGITIAGLGIIDLKELSRQLALPVISVTRSGTTSDELKKALNSAGLSDRIDIVKKTPASQKVQEGIHITAVGIPFPKAQKLVETALLKARLPEPLRMAHLIATAVSTGESKGNP